MAIAFVSDRGTAGDVSAGTTTTLTLTSPTAITVGNYLILRVAVDNAGSGGATPGLTVTDSRSHTWTTAATHNNDPGSENQGITGFVVYTKVTTAFQTSDALTLTWGTSVTAKAAVLEEWHGIRANSPVAVTAVTAGGSGANPSVSITPTAAGQLVYGAIAIEGLLADTYTVDADTTDGSWVTGTSLASGTGTATSNVVIRGQAKIALGTSAQTYNLTITSRDRATMVVVFAAEPVPTVVVSVPVRLVIPYYDYASFNDADITAIIDNPVPNTVVIFNVNTGPGASYNSDYGHETDRLRDAGIDVVGYVWVDYAERSITTVKDEVDDWYTFYEADGLAGIFFDLTPTGATGDKVSYCEEIADYVRDTYGSDQLVLFNPGTYPLQAAGYVDPADLVCVWEADYDLYANTMVVPSYATWVSSVRPEKLWHLVYDASDATEMRNALQIARSKGAGAFYATQGPGTWTTFASYYSDLADAALEHTRPVATTSTVPAPTLSGGAVVAGNYGGAGGYGGGQYGSSLAIVTTSTIPTPTITTAAGGTDATPTPATVATTTAVGSATISAGSTVTPAVVASTASVGTVGLSTGSTVSPATVASLAGIPAPTVNTGATVTPSVVATSSAIGAAVISAAATVTPTTVATSSTVGTAVISTSSAVTPTTVATTTSVPAPVISAGTTVAPASVATTSTVPAPVISAGAAVSPATVSTATSIGVPTIGTSSGVTVSPATVATTTAIGSPSIAAGAVVTPSTVSTITGIPSPVLSAGATATPATVGTTTAVHAPAIQASSTALCETVATLTAVGVPVVSCGATAAPQTILTTTAVPQPVIITAGPVTTSRIRLTSAEPTGDLVSAEPATAAHRQGRDTSLTTAPGSDTLITSHPNSVLPAR